jgi:hypothetical protein
VPIENIVHIVTIEVTVLAADLLVVPTVAFRLLFVPERCSAAAFITITGSRLSGAFGA